MPFIFAASHLTPDEWSGLVAGLEEEGHYFIMVSDDPPPELLGPFNSFYEWPNWGVVSRKGDTHHDRVLGTMRTYRTGRTDVAPGARPLTGAVTMQGPSPSEGEG